MNLGEPGAAWEAAVLAPGWRGGGGGLRAAEAGGGGREGGVSDCGSVSRERVKILPVPLRGQETASGEDLV